MADTADHTDIITPFLTEACEGKQESTIRRYKYDLELFTGWCGENGTPPGRCFSPEHADAFFLYLCNDKGYSILTIRRILSVLKQCFLYHRPSRTVSPFDRHLSSQTAEHRKNSHNFISTDDIQRLLKTVQSSRGLSEHQLKNWHFYRDRNQAIIHLMLFYGLSVQEVTGLVMNQVHFQSGVIELRSRKGKPRSITLDDGDRILLHRYYQTVPEPVRPRWHTGDPLFAAFDFQRGTYRWNYEDESPKRLTPVSVQKMIRQEVRRAGIRRGISARMFRSTYILHRLLENATAEELKEELAFTTVQPLDPYKNYLMTFPEETGAFTPIPPEQRNHLSSGNALREDKNTSIL
ncbi:tyrosine-type recombinase/integrase [Alteribacter natronophilus]|uniref:tyrosine-type recombinase/integrase n=1 Tax=Alteribacter natronophilus TaxID=2583810 RepID=UPI001486861A|nr:tyrosine-type recombinase/integrase [Alteribacter natronophilus]